MSSLIEHVERFEVAQLEAILNEQPKCESTCHSTPGPTDRHGGPATHWQSGDVCEHGNGLRCGPHVENVIQWGGAYCHICNLDIPVSQIRFVEL